MNFIQELKNHLLELDPIFVDIEDQSQQHANHQQSQNKAHLKLTIVTNRFQGLPQLARHRLIYCKISKFMQNSIHALSIKAYTQQEALQNTTLTQKDYQ